MRIRASLLIAALIGGVLAAQQPPGHVLKVPAGGDLQAALNRARGGDTVLVERGATYSGNFTLPARADGDGGVITVRTEGDRGFPSDGERMTPAAAAELAKIQSPNSGPALATAPGTRGWRLLLLEFAANRGGVGDIITLGDGSSAQNTLAAVPSELTLDRLYIHGDARLGQKRGIALNSSATVVRGCYISDIKTVGQDSQAILGWNGPGDYVIENNYLEAAGDNVMFGSADPSIRNLVPTKIVVRGNVLAKPLAWREPGAQRWQVKNIFELKNARQVVVERNVLEHSWLDAQTGYAVLFTTRNQDGACPWCIVEDVEFSGNLVREAGGGVQVLGTDNGHPSGQTNRIRIHDNVFHGIDRKWGGDGYFLQLSDSPRDITIDHNTIVQGDSGGIVKIADGVTQGFVFTNNIVMHGEYGIIGTNRGVGADSIAAFLPGAVITGNAIAGGDSSRYPRGNKFSTIDEFRRQFIAFEGHDYRLTPQSRWRKAGSDGRDLGADLAVLASAAQSPAISPDRQ